MFLQFDLYPSCNGCLGQLKTVWHAVSHSVTVAMVYCVITIDLLQRDVANECQNA